MSKGMAYWGLLPLGMVLSLKEIRSLGGFADGDYVESQAHDWYGIEEDAAVWRLETFPLRELVGWWADPELEEDQGYIAEMVETLKSRGSLPPIIVVRHPPVPNADHPDGLQSMSPLDGSHRVAAARQAGLESLPAWVAQSDRS